MCRHDDPIETISTTAGRAIPGVEVQLIDEDGGPVATGDPGEVVVRGYNVMRGYFNDPGATAATIDDEGWLHTGDVAVMDEHGNVRITDRIKDMFIVGGFNCYPAEIEGMLLRHPAIGRGRGRRRPDHRMGEVGMASSWVRPGAEATPTSSSPGP
jgi:acyl-CoA synthetase (AMP-forming)/AMP-acid ligase II